MEKINNTSNSHLNKWNFSNYFANTKQKIHSIIFSEKPNNQEKKETSPQVNVLSNIKEEKSEQINIEKIESIWTNFKENKYNFIWSINEETKFFLLKNLYVNVFCSIILVWRNVIIPIQHYTQKILFKNLWDFITTNQSIYLNLILTLPLFYLVFKGNNAFLNKLNYSWYENISTELSNNGKTCNIHIELNQENKNEWKKFIENIIKLIDEIKQKNWKYKKVEKICFSSHLFGKSISEKEQKLSMIWQNVIKELNINEFDIKKEWKLGFMRIIVMYKKMLFEQNNYNFRKIKEVFNRVLEIRKKTYIYKFTINI